MKKTVKVALVAIAATAVAMTGISASQAATSKRACVILPDSDSGTRWEPGDRPALNAILTKAGFTTDIQNAQKDTAKFATIADQQLAKGCGVMILLTSRVLVYQ